MTTVLHTPLVRPGGMRLWWRSPWPWIGLFMLVFYGAFWWGYTHHTATMKATWGMPVLSVCYLPDRTTVGWADADIDKATLTHPNRKIHLDGPCMAVWEMQHHPVH